MGIRWPVLMSTCWWCPACSPRCRVLAGKPCSPQKGAGKGVSDTMGEDDGERKYEADEDGIGDPGLCNRSLDSWVMVA